MRYTKVTVTQLNSNFSIAHTYITFCPRITNGTLTLDMQ
jgi:hypothetical protein